MGVRRHRLPSHPAREQFHLSSPRWGELGREILTRLNHAVSRAKNWRPGRRAAVVALVLLPVSGALAGAGFQRGQGLEHEAAAGFAIGNPPFRTTASPAERTRLAVAAAELPGVAAEVQRQGFTEPPEELASRVTATGNPDVGLVELTARGASSAAAASLANGYAQALARLVSETPPTGSRPASIEDFEAGPSDWLGKTGDPGVAPAAFSITRTMPRYGTQALAVECQVTAPCAASETIDYPLRAGEDYLVTLWIRPEPAAASTIRGSLALGGDDDQQQSDFAISGRKWRRQGITWTPRENVNLTQFAVITNGGIAIDGVALWDAGRSGVSSASPAPLDAERRAFDSRAQVTIFPARATGFSQSADALVGGAIGAGGGLLAALAAIGAVLMAAGTRPRTESL